MYFQAMGSQTWEAIFDQEESKMDERLQKQLAVEIDAGDTYAYDAQG